MVAVSVFAVKGLWAVPVFAQVAINCAVGLGLGVSAQCSSTAVLVINPDGSSMVTSGCLAITSPVKAGQCVISATGPLTKNVRVDFAKTFVDINNGTKQVHVDSLKMQYTPTVAAASKFTFTPAEISNTVTINIGGTAHIGTSQGLGIYTGNITVRANPI